MVTKKIALNNHSVKFPWLPSWPIKFRRPELLSRFRNGLNISVNGTTLANARAEWTDGQVIDIKANGYDHVKYSFYGEELCKVRGSATFDADAAACLVYVFQQFMRQGIDVIICLYSGGQIFADLHSNLPGQYNRTWLVQFWTNVYRLLRALPEWRDGAVRFLLQNEPVIGVDQSAWSMTTYNAMLAEVFPQLRALDHNLVWHVCLYLYASPGSYTFGGVDLVLPNDDLLVVEMHLYHRGEFLNQGLNQGPSDLGIWGMRWIYGMKWGWTLAQIKSYLASWTAGGAYNTDPQAKAQIDNWRANIDAPGQVDSTGFTDASFEVAGAALLAFCAANRLPLYIGEYGVIATYTPAAFAVSMSWEDGETWMRSATRFAAAHQLGVCFWIHQGLCLDTDTPGHRRLVKDRVQANLATQTYGR